MADGVDRSDPNVKRFLQGLELELYASYPAEDDDDILLSKKVASIGLFQLGGTVGEASPAVPNIEVTLVPYVSDDKLLALKPNEATFVKYRDF